MGGPRHPTKGPPVHAQLTYLDGPRSPQLVAAGDHAGLDRILPLLARDPQVVADLVAIHVLRRPDGGEVIITLVRTEESLQRAGELISTSTLLPDEDAALLPGPDRVEVYPVVHSVTGEELARGTTGSPR